MFTKRKFKIWVIIGGSGLGVLGILLLLQYKVGKQPINTTAPSSTVQMAPDTQRRWIKPPSAINTPQQRVKTNPSPSKKPENVPTTPDTSEQAPTLDKEDTIRSLVDSLSDGDIQALQGLTIRDILSDEELEKLDRKMVESLKEFVTLVPRIVELRARVGALMVYDNNVSKQKNWYKDREKYEEVVKNNELINEMLNELDTLRDQASDLESFLLDSDFDSIGPKRNKEWIQKLAEENVWSTKGWPPELQPKHREEP